METAIGNEPTLLQELSLDEIEAVGGGALPAGALVLAGAAAGGLVAGVVVGLVILAAVDYLY